MAANPKDPLVGKFFLSRDPDDGRINWQGRIVAPLEGGYYLLQLYEWIMGMESDMVIVHIDRMAAAPFPWWITDDEDFWKAKAEERSRR